MNAGNVDKACKSSGSSVLHKGILISGKLSLNKGCSIDFWNGLEYVERVFASS